MTRADAQAFSVLLAGLAETFDVTLSATRTELYFRALEDLPLAELQRAAGRALRESRYFPKPVELRELAGQDTETQADLAWLALLEAFQDGYYAVTLPDDPILGALVSVYWGSPHKAREWWRFCHEATLESRRKEFVARYQDYAARPREALPRLPGGRGLIPMLEEATRGHATRSLPDHGRAASLPLSDLRVDLGVHSDARPDSVSRPGQASGAPEGTPPPRPAARRRAGDGGGSAVGGGGE